MIELKDWGCETSKRRHALFCMAYMMLQGRGRSSACARLGPKLKINREALRHLSYRYIKARKVSSSHV